MILINALSAKIKDMIYQQTYHHAVKCLVSKFGKHNRSQAVTSHSALFTKLHHSILFKTSWVWLSVVDAVYYYINSAIS